MNGSRASPSLIEKNAFSPQNHSSAATCHDDNCDLVERPSGRYPDGGQGITTGDITSDF